MDSTISALIGIFIGFLLPTIAGLIKSKTVGIRFANAVRQELTEAAQHIHAKMIWLSRDVAAELSGKDEALIVEHQNRFLFLGEPEGFEVPLCFWQDNLREIAEILDTKTFNAICRQVALVRQFEGKFRDMKTAFTFSDQDSKKMALTCFWELQKIHDALVAASSL